MRQRWGILGGYRRVATYGHTPSAAANTDCWEGTGLIMTTNEYVVEPSVPMQRSVIVGAVIPEKTTLTTRITAVTGAGNSGFSSFEGVMMDNVNLA